MKRAPGGSEGRSLASVTMPAKSADAEAIREILRLEYRSRGAWVMPIACTVAALLLAVLRMDTETGVFALKWGELSGGGTLSAALVLVGPLYYWLAQPKVSIAPDGAEASKDEGAAPSAGE